jgi:hypothetical protein
MPLLTELGKLFRPGFYNDAVPDGTENSGNPVNGIASAVRREQGSELITCVRLRISRPAI